MRCFQIKHYPISESSLSDSYAILSCSLIHVLHYRRLSSLLKSLDTEAKTGLFPDCSLAPTNCCYTGMLYLVVLEPLTNRKKPKYRFYIKNILIFKITTLAKQKTCVAQIWFKYHMFATSKLRKNVSVLYL